MTLRITQAVEADLPDLLALYRHLSPEDPPPDPDQALAAFRRFHLYVGSAILLGRVQDHAVTTGSLIVVPNLTRQAQPYALTENVVTHAVFRHQGHGKTLLRRATELGWDRGCPKVMLLTGSKSDATLNF